MFGCQKNCRWLLETQKERRKKPKLTNIIKDLLENYVLIQKIRESEEDESFDAQSARMYYKKLLGEQEWTQKR